jgi:hypothetical protein
LAAAAPAANAAPCAEMEGVVVGGSRLHFAHDDVVDVPAFVLVERVGDEVEADADFLPGELRKIERSVAPAVGRLRKRAIRRTGQCGATVIAGDLDAGFVVRRFDAQQIVERQLDASRGALEVDPRRNGLSLGQRVVRAGGSAAEVQAAGPRMARLVGAERSAGPLPAADSYVVVEGEPAQAGFEITGQAFDRRFRLTAPHRQAVGAICQRDGRRLQILGRGRRIVAGGGLQQILEFESGIEREVDRIRDARARGGSGDDRVHAGGLDADAR